MGKSSGHQKVIKSPARKITQGTPTRTPQFTRHSRGRQKSVCETPRLAPYRTPPPRQKHRRFGITASHSELPLKFLPVLFVSFDGLCPEIFLGQSSVSFTLALCIIGVILLLWRKNFKRHTCRDLLSPQSSSKYMFSSLNLPVMFFTSLYAAIFRVCMF